MIMTKTRPNTSNLYQVIARENKSGSYGIDYKFSDMINNFAKGGKSSDDAEITTRSPTRTDITTMRTPTSTMRSSLPANLQQRAPPPPPPPTPTTTTTAYPTPTTKSSYTVRSSLPPTFSENLAEVKIVRHIL